jgi:hypothetical protein
MNESGTKPAGPDSRDQHESAYQEIHGAIQELYRLMGVPRAAHPAAGGAYFPGYSAYVYPSTGPGYVQGWTGIGVTQPRPMGSPVADPLTAASFMNQHHAATFAGHPARAYATVPGVPHMPGWINPGTTY